MTAFTTPDTDPTGQFTDSRWNTYIRDNFTHVHDIPTLLAKNTSGSTVSPGAVVAVSITADAEFTTTTTAGDTRVIGVVQDTSIANNAYGFVQLSGRHAAVQVTGTVARGDVLETSTTAGRAQTSGTGAGFARALTPLASGTGTIVALLAPGGASAAGATVDYATAAWLGTD